MGVGVGMGVDPGSERGAGGDDKSEVREKGREEARTVLTLLLRIVELARRVFIFAEQLAAVASEGGKEGRQQHARRRRQRGRLTP